MIAKLKNILVIIPARKGSKRIPNKNVKKIFGQPMIYWPLKVLSKMFPAENVLVSTDSEMVKTLVEKKGLIIPFKRPSNLSGDFTGTTEVIKHAADWYELNVRKVEYVLTIYPTAVMLSEADIHLAVDMLINDINCELKFCNEHLVTDEFAEKTYKIIITEFVSKLNIKLLKQKFPKSTFELSSFYNVFEEYFK